MSALRPSRAWTALVAAALLWLSVAAPGAYAQEPPGYGQTIDDALAEYAAHHFEEAHALFLGAHAAFPSARTLRGLAMTEFELRRYVDCVAHLEEALQSTVRPLDGNLRQHAEALLARARQYVARVEVSVTPALTVTLSVDGMDVAPGPDGALMLQLGEHLIEARATGHQVARQRITVEGGAAQSVRLTLEPIAETAATTSVVAAPAAATASGGQARKDDSRSIWKSPWLWVAAGVIVAGVVTGVVLATSGGTSANTVADPIRTPNTPPNVVVVALH